eukprot:gene11594-11387_t
MTGKLLDDFVGKLTTSKWAKMTKCSQDTALRDIQDLLQQTLAQQTDEKGRIDTLVDMGVEVRNIDVEHAMKMAEDIISRSKTVGYARGIGRGLNLKGSCFWLQGEYDDGLATLKDALSIAERINDKRLEARVLHNFGNIYRDMGDFANATAAYVMAESGLGKVYYKMQDFGNSSKFLTDALREAQLLGNVEVQIICHFYLGRLYMDDGNYRQALHSLNAAYTLADEYMRRHDLVSVHEMMSVLYDKMGDIPNAFHHLKSYEKLKEEIFQQKIINELRNLQ